MNVSALYALESYLDTLQCVVNGLSPRRPFTDGLEDVLSALAEHLHFFRPHIVVQNPASGSLYVSMAHGQQALPCLTYAPVTGLTGQVFTQARPLIVERMKDDPDFMNRPFERSEEQLAQLAFLCVPVFENAEQGERTVIGTLSADTPVAPMEELAVRRHFLESVAALVARQVAYVQVELIREQLRQPRRNDSPLPRCPSIVALSKSMNHVLHHAAQVAPGRTTALLRGETGTGKELLAGAIHSFSSRCDKPFIKFNCAALPGELVEGELFGWNKGAFTGALQDRHGLFEQAHTGTLFLDEIGDLSLAAQAKLLRAIQEEAIVRLGSEHPVKVNVRLVCATHRPLEKLVEQHLFREDLYYRINEFPLFMPSLRERREDVLPLADHFLESFAREHGREAKRLSAPVCDLLQAYSWPGNVRELRNALERAVLVCESECICACHLPPAIRFQQNGAGEAMGSDFQQEIEQLEQRLLAGALWRAQGNIHQAARDLGITYRICQYKLKKYCLNFHDYEKNVQA